MEIHIYKTNKWSKLLSGPFSDKSVQRNVTCVWSVTGSSKHLTIFNFEIWWADCSTICKLSIHFYGNLIRNLSSRWYFEMLKIIYEQVLTTTAVAHTNFI